MIKQFAFITAAMLTLTACDSAQEAVTKGTRDTAKTVVNQVVESKFPGVNAKSGQYPTAKVKYRESILTLLKDAF